MTHLHGVLGGLSRLFRRAPRAIRVSIWLFTLSVVALVVGYDRWIWAVPEEASILEAALEFVGREVEYTTPAALAWERATTDGWAWVEGGGGGADVFTRWGGFLTPPTPPALCRPNPSSTDSPALRQMHAALSAVRANRKTGFHRPDLEEQLAASVDALSVDRQIPFGSFLREYNLALGAMEARMHSDAGQAVASIPNTDPEFLPSLGQSRARWYRSANQRTTGDVLRTFLGRYVSGLVQLQRTDMGREAIAQFRLAINTVNYMDALPLGSSHANRTPISIPIEWLCERNEVPELSSLDPYLGLVAAYLATPDYTEPDSASYRREFSRSGSEMERGDPLRPIVLYAQGGGRYGVPGAIPENVLWAASNLQRLRRLNRTNESLQLEVATAALALQIVATPSWVADLSARQGFDSCSFLERVWEGLERQGRRLLARPGESLSLVDQSLAAVAIYVAGAMNDCCADPPETDPLARSGLLRAATPFLADGLSGLYEQRRLRLSGIRAGNAITDALLDSLHLEQRDLERGQRPEFIKQPFETGAGAQFVAQWRQAIFADLAATLTRVAERGEGFARNRNSGGAEFVMALEGATRLARAQPDDLYAWGSVAPLLQGESSMNRGMRWWRYVARSNPGTHVGIVALLFLWLMLFAVWFHVLWWRLKIADARAYGEERRAWERAGKPGAARLLVSAGTMNVGKQG